MNRISFAFRSFFSILFGGTLAADIAQSFGYFRPAPVRMQQPPATAPAAAPAKEKVQAKTQDGTVQILALLQRDARLIDFLMEDLASYSDEQVGAAVRDVQAQSKQLLVRHFKPTAVIDAIEGDPVKIANFNSADLRFTGNIPAKGTAPAGVLRHKGWKASMVDLPSAPSSLLLAAAEIEVE